MPSFDTPQPISVHVELGVGHLRVTAADRPDTRVEVRPSDPSNDRDVAAAEHTEVELNGARLVVRAPLGRRQFTPRRGRESVDVTIELPAGSDLDGEAGLAWVTTSGRLGECRFKTGAGDLHVQQAGPVHLRTGAGDVTVDGAAGLAEVRTGSGALRIGRVEGTAVVKSSNGDTWIGEVTGDLRVNAANGRISVEHAHQTVAAKTSMGDVRLGAVQREAVVAQTAMGNVHVGILDGVPAWLDLHTDFGTVDNRLDAAEQPPPGQQTVSVRARTSMGDITVERSAGHVTAPGQP